MKTQSQLAQTVYKQSGQMSVSMANRIATAIQEAISKGNLKPHVHLKRLCGSVVDFEIR